MIVCASGHRPNALGGYGQESVHKLFGFAKHVLSSMCPDEVVSGMALGWDQAVASASSVLGIPWVAAVPFDGQESAWPGSSQKAYRELIKSAYRIHVVSPGGYSAYKMQVRNEWMVNNSDEVLALWSGSFGGTYNCVMYATSVGKKVVNVWQDWIAWP